MILIVAEHTKSALAKSTLEAISAARQLQREGPITALVLGAGVGAAAAQAATLCDQVLVADTPALAQYDAELWAAAVAQVAEQGEATSILTATTRAAREWGPRVAVKLNAALLEDVTAIADAAGTITASRYTFLGRVTEQVQATGTIVASIQSGAFSPAEPLSAATPAEQYDADLELPAPRLHVTGRVEEKSSRVALADAAIVVAGGRGVGSAEGFTTLIEPLADKLGAAIAATRAVVDSGWRPYAEQVGQTGKTVQPKLYIAVGISGAVQHLSGMGKSKLIVAINKDPDAPILQEADYAITGDVHQIVPALLEALNQ